MIVSAAQISPVLLDREATLAKVLSWAGRAADEGAALVAFPETVLPGYPTWLARTGGATFDDPLQKTLHAAYLDQALELPGPALTQLQELAADRKLSLLVGVAERGRTDGRGTLWCTLLHVHPDGRWLAHRKLVPTYEERLAWGSGDGHGLRAQQVGAWRVGALNCWENWMPAARMALWADGAELLVSCWPGRPELTRDISRFSAREGRVWVLAASGVLHADELPGDLPARDELVASTDDGWLHAGGSRVVGPDGRELLALDEPIEGLLTAQLDRELLLGERQNFDPAGHYHRPDVFHFEVDRRRQRAASFREDEDDVAD